jgi:ABC-2 type transport system ATP-binding protein
MELRDRGRTLIFSTHQMEAAEALCESVAIVDHGRMVAGGKVRDLKRASGRRTIRLTVQGGVPAWLATTAGVDDVRPVVDGAELELAPAADPSAILAAIVGGGAAVTRFDVVEPSLEALFIEHVGRPSDDETQLAADVVAPSLPAGGLA